MSHKFAQAALAASVCTFALPSVAVAQEAPAARSPEEGGLDDIVVTARKRSESLISVPVAVTALGAKDLARYSTSQLSQISQLAPQILITSAPTGSGASLSIRGIGSVSEDPGVDQSVGIYFDNVGLGRGRILSMAMMDIQQVEILKGPQALFFGKNSPAGVVSVTSAGPGSSWEGRALAGYEFEADEAYVEAAVGGPVSETLGVRLAARAQRMKGWARNVAPAFFDPLAGVMAPGAGNSREPRTRNYASRLTLKWEPNSDFNAVAKIFGGYNRTNNPTAGVEAVCGPGVSASWGGVPDPIEKDDCTLNHIKTNAFTNPALVANWPHTNNGVPYGKTRFVMGSLTTNTRLGDLDLTTVTGASYLKYQDFYNACQCSFQILIPQATEVTKSFSQEIRLNSDYDGPLNFTIGGYYEHVNRTNPNAVALLFLGPDPRVPQGQGRTWNFTRDADNKSSTLSAFTQLRWDITDQVELAGGVRYSRDHKKVRIGNSFVNPILPLAFGAGFVLPEGVFFNGKYRNSNWSPEATLTWHPTPSQTFYGAYKTGYKSGGFSNPLLLGAAFTIDNLTYKPEKTKGGEIGYKAEFFGRTLRLETTAYIYKFTNLQLSAFEARTFSYFIRNAAAARTTGAEINVEWQATSDLTLRSDFAYNRAKFLRFPGSPCYQGQTVAQGCVGGSTQDLAGQPLSRAPRLVYTLGGSYELPVSDTLVIGLDADARHSSSYFTDGPHSPFIKQRGYWLFSAGIRLHPENNRWEVAVLGRNLGDKVYSNYGADNALTPVGLWTVQGERSRQIALQASVKF